MMIARFFTLTRFAKHSKNVHGLGKQIAQSFSAILIFTHVVCAKSLEPML